MHLIMLMRLEPREVWQQNQRLPQLHALFEFVSTSKKVPPPKMPIRYHVKLLKIEISMTTDTNSLGSQ